MIATRRGESRRHYPELEGYRAVAAIAVAVYHFTTPYWFGDEGVAGRTVGRWGELGVCVFFLLSGFVLYRPRVTAALDDGPTEPLGRYLAFRVLRIVPAYWLTLTFMVFALWNVNPYLMPNWDGTVPLADHLRFFGFAQIYDPATAILGLGVAWTLCVELVFYLTLPGLAWGLTRLSSGARDLRSFRRRQLAGIAGLAAIGLGFRAFMFSSPSTTPEGVTWPIGYLTWFAAGMALALASVLGQRGMAPTRPVSGLLATQKGGLAIAALAYAAMAAFTEPHGPAQTTTDLQVKFVLAVIFSAGLLGPVVLPTTPRSGPIERALRTPTMQFLGRISFGIYLWHLLWIRVIRSWVASGLVPDLWPVEAALVAVLTLCASIVTYEVAEAPVMRWKASLRERNRRANPVVAVAEP